MMGTNSQAGGWELFPLVKRRPRLRGVLHTAPHSQSAQQVTRTPRSTGAPVIADGEGGVVSEHNHGWAVLRSPLTHRSVEVVCETTSTSGHVSFHENAFADGSASEEIKQRSPSRLGPTLLLGKIQRRL